MGRQSSAANRTRRTGGAEDISWWTGIGRTPVISQATNGPASISLPDRMKSSADRSSAKDWISGTSALSRCSRLSRTHATLSLPMESYHQMFSSSVPGLISPVTFRYRVERSITCDSGSPILSSITLRFHALSSHPDWRSFNDTINIRPFLHI